MRHAKGDRSCVVCRGYIVSTYQHIPEAFKTYLLLSPVTKQSTVRLEFHNQEPLDGTSSPSSLVGSLEVKVADITDFESRGQGMFQSTFQAFTSLTSIPRQ